MLTNLNMIAARKPIIISAIWAVLCQHLVNGQNHYLMNNLSFVFPSNTRFVVKALALYQNYLFAASSGGARSGIKRWQINDLNISINRTGTGIGFFDQLIVTDEYLLGSPVSNRNVSSISFDLNTVVNFGPTNNSRKILSVAISGEYFYVGFDDDLIDQWRVTDGSFVKTVGQSNPVRGMAVNDNMLFVTGGNGVTSQWNVDTAENVRNFTANNSAVILVATIDDNLFVSTQRNIIQWRISDGTRGKMYIGHADQLTALYASGDYIFSCGTDSVLKQWRISDQSFVRVYLHDTALGSIVSRGPFLFVGGIGWVYQWYIPELETKTVIVRQTSIVNQIKTIQATVLSTVSANVDGQGFTLPMTSIAAFSLLIAGWSLVAVCLVALLTLWNRKEFYRSIAEKSKFGSTSYLAQWRPAVSHQTLPMVAQQQSMNNIYSSPSVNRNQNMDNMYDMNNNPMIHNNVQY
jgi:hypothetical protein